MLFDSHAHLNSERYAEDWDQVIKDIEESDLSYVMDVGFDLESSVKTVEHTKKYSWCYGAVGCHPHDAKTMDDMSLIMLKGLAKKAKDNGYWRNWVGLLSQSFATRCSAILVSTSDSIGPRARYAYYYP